MPEDRWSTYIKTFIPRIQYIASKHHSLRIMIKNDYKTVGLITCEISPRYEAFASIFLFNFERVLRNIWKGIQSLESSFDSHTGDSLVWSFSVTLYQLITICADVGHKIVVNQELRQHLPLGKAQQLEDLPTWAQARGNYRLLVPSSIQTILEATPMSWLEQKANIALGLQPLPLGNLSKICWTLLWQEGAPHGKEGSTSLRLITECCKLSVIRHSEVAGFF